MFAVMLFGQFLATILARFVAVDFGFPTFAEIWAALGGKLIVLVVLMGFDFIMGVVISLVYGEFKLEYLSNYLKSDLLPIFAWAMVGFINFIPTQYVPEGISMVFETVVYATVFLSIFASICAQLERIGVMKNTFNRLGIYSNKPMPEKLSAKSKVKKS